MLSILNAFYEGTSVAERIIQAMIKQKKTSDVVQNSLSEMLSDYEHMLNAAAMNFILSRMHAEQLTKSQIDMVQYHIVSAWRDMYYGGRQLSQFNAGRGLCLHVINLYHHGIPVSYMDEYANALACESERKAIVIAAIDALLKEDNRVINMTYISQAAKDEIIEASRESYSPYSLAPVYKMFIDGTTATIVSDIVHPEQAHKMDMWATALTCRAKGEHNDILADVSI